MSFICIIIKNHFHINSFALSLALKVRFFGTRKWPIRLPLSAWKRSLSLYGPIHSWRLLTTWNSHVGRQMSIIFLFAFLPMRDAQMHSNHVRQTHQ